MDSSKPSSALATLATRGWVSLRQFATLIGVSYPTVLRLKDRGAVKTVLVGSIYRVYNDEATRFLAEGNHPSTKNQPAEGPQ